MPIVPSSIEFRSPLPEEGGALWELVGQVGTLERNTAYAYLLITHFFADTSLVAQEGERLVGMVTGFCPPHAPDQLFIWQVGTLPEYRGQGIGKAMLLTLLTHPTLRSVRYLMATVTPSNTASQALFRQTAKALQAPCEVSEGFPAAWFPDGNHEPEELFQIGPLHLR